MCISDWSSDGCSSDLDWKSSHLSPQKCGESSKHGELIRVFSLSLTALARKPDDIFILLVGKVEHMNLSAFGQMSLDSPKVSLIVFFAIAEPSIDRKLAHFKAFIKQKFPEFRRFARVFLGVHRQVEHYEYPHQPVST